MRYMVVWITYCHSFPYHRAPFIHIHAFSKRRRHTKSDLLSKHVFNIAKRSRVKFANWCLSRVCTSLLMISGSESRPGEICSLLTAFKWESQSYCRISRKKVERWKCVLQKGSWKPGHSLWLLSSFEENLKINKFNTKCHPKYVSYFSKLFWYLLLHGRK